MDNRLFNVNGRGEQVLLKTLELAFSHEGWNKPTTCSGWQQTKENGLILCWCASENTEGVIAFPSSLSAIECLPFVTSWLKSDFAKTVEFGKWCNNYDHDGHNVEGWQVYCEDWGHVGGQHYSICAIRLAHLWMGK